MTIHKQAVKVTTSSGEPRGFEVTEEDFGQSGLALTLSGELDIATAPALRERLETAMKAGKHRLVLDLCALDFLDSVALATIVHAKKELPEHGKLAIAIDPSSYVMLIFESSGLNKALDLVDSRERAMALVSS